MGQIIASESIDVGSVPSAWVGGRQQAACALCWAEAFFQWVQVAMYSTPNGAFVRSNTQIANNNNNCLLCRFVSEQKEKEKERTCLKGQTSHHKRNDVLGWKTVARSAIAAAAGSNVRTKKSKEAVGGSFRAGKWCTLCRQNAAAAVACINKGSNCCLQCPQLGRRESKREPKQTNTESSAVKGKEWEGKELEKCAAGANKSG